MMTRTWFQAAVVASAVAAALVAATGSANAGEAKAKVIYATTPVKVDGALDDAVWRDAKVYKLKRSVNDSKTLPPLQDQGTVRFAWDAQFLYMAVEFSDSDLVALMEKDDEPHYKFGDVAELFVKAADKPGYWELYVTPAGYKTSFFTPSRGYQGLPDIPEVRQTGLAVGVKFRGTLNNPKDTDAGWTAEMAMPLKDLESNGDKFAPGQKWKIFADRCNYAIGFADGQERSRFPRLPVATRSYAVLDILPPPEK